MTLAGNRTEIDTPPANCFPHVNGARFRWPEPRAADPGGSVRHRGGSSFDQSPHDPEIGSDGADPESHDPAGGNRNIDLRKRRPARAIVPPKNATIMSEQIRSWRLWFVFDMSAVRADCTGLDWIRKVS